MLRYNARTTAKEENKVFTVKNNGGYLFPTMVFTFSNPIGKGMPMQYPNGKIVNDIMKELNKGCPEIVSIKCLLINKWYNKNTRIPVKAYFNNLGEYFLALKLPTPEEKSKAPSMKIKE